MKQLIISKQAKQLSLRKINRLFYPNYWLMSCRRNQSLRDAISNSVFQNKENLHIILLKQKIRKWGTMNSKEKIESNSLQQKNIIGRWLEEEMLEIAKSLRTEFYELGEVSTETKKRLKEVLEDKNKREKFAEVLSKEVEEEESFDEFMINLISEKDRDN